jgi:hypothetical protein
MKFRTLTSFFLLMACSILWLGNKDGRANGGNEGATGAPDDNPTDRTCQNCHNSSSTIQVTLDVEMLDLNGELTTVYEPGETYSIIVRINSLGSEEPEGYGFQMVSLEDDLTPVNNWGDPEAGIGITTLNNGRAYAEHLLPSTENEFMVEWTAPDAGTGAVTFYAAGNGVNGNNASSGDGAAINNLQIFEAGTVSTNERYQNNLNISLFPVPAEDFVNILVPAEVKGSFQILLLDNTGRTLFSQEALSSGGTTTYQLPVEDLSTGMYFVQIVSEAGSGISRLVKL